MKRIYGMAMVVVMTALPAFAGQDLDIAPRLAGGKVVTDGIADVPTDPQIVNDRVYTYTMGDPTAAYTEDPGFKTNAGAEQTALLPASNLTPGSVVSFRVLSGLQYWNGMGGVSFGPATAHDSLDWNFGSQDVIVTGSTAAQAGLNMGTVDSTGVLHHHAQAQLFNDLATGADPLDPLADDGIYRVLIQLQVSDPAIGQLYLSDPIYVLYDNDNSTDSVLDAARDAADAATTASVPEPASIGMLGMGVMWMLRRRVKKG